MRANAALIEAVLALGGGERSDHNVEHDRSLALHRPRWRQRLDPAPPAERERMWQAMVNAPFGEGDMNLDPIADEPEMFPHGDGMPPADVLEAIRGGPVT